LFDFLAIKTVSNTAIKPRRFRQSALERRAHRRN
jgi:hypothetical protein